MNDKLNTITARFSRVYDRANKAKQSLAKRQKEMFEAFTHELEQQPLARRTVIFPESWEGISDKQRAEWVKLYHPGYRLVSYHDGNVILEQDPTLMKFTYVNPETKEVYGRTLVEGSPNLDDEWMREHDPELWEHVTEWPEPWKSLVADVIHHYTSLPISPDALEKTVGRFLRERGAQRVLKDFSRLTDTDLMMLEDYFLPGQVSVRLVPPREAKPEELEYVQQEEKEEAQAE